MPTMPSETDKDLSAKLQFQATFDIAEITADVAGLDEQTLDLIIRAWEAGASCSLKLCKQLLVEEAAK